MMTIKKLRESMKDPIVREDDLIRKTLEEMSQLPTNRWCKSSVIITKTKQKLGPYTLEKISSILGVDPEDERIDTLGKVATKVYAHRHERKKYGAMLALLSGINGFFGLPKREE